MIALVVRGLRYVKELATPLGRGTLRARRRGAQLMQPATVTWFNRHPELFTQVAAFLALQPAPRLLSFGCSTGEEAFTLASLLPKASIDAVDANPVCIDRARRSAANQGLSRIRFACADIPDAFAPLRYDAIFCLSVLRHGDLELRRPEHCGDHLSFARFQAAVEALDRCLFPGGLLVIWGCQFRLSDTVIAEGYEVVPTPTVRPQPGPYYGADDRLLPDDSYSDCIFVKKG